MNRSVDARADQARATVRCSCHHATARSSSLARPGFALLHGRRPRASVISRRARIAPVPRLGRRRRHSIGDNPAATLAFRFADQGAVGRQLNQLCSGIIAAQLVVLRCAGTRERMCINQLAHGSIPTTFALIFARDRSECCRRSIGMTAQTAGRPTGRTMASEPATNSTTMPSTSVDEPNSSDDEKSRLAAAVRLRLALRRAVGLQRDFPQRVCHRRQPPWSPWALRDLA